MADKEIIIDGVDVSECVSFDKLNGLNICCYDDTRNDKIPFANFCVENKNCSFKQLKRKEQEYEKYKEKVEYIHAFLKNPYNYGSFRPMWGSFLLHWLFNENLGDFFPEKAYEMSDTIAEKEKQIIKYNQALDEIEEFCVTYSDNHDSYETVYKHILDIIKKQRRRNV